jgi:hypothetical protein
MARVSTTSPLWVDRPISGSMLNVAIASASSSSMNRGAAAAAIAFVFAQHLAAPLVGSNKVLVFSLAGCTVAYAALLGSTGRRAIRNAVAAFIGAVLVVIGSSGMMGLAIGLTSVLGFVRSGLESSRKPIRGLVVELLLGGGGLGFACWVYSPGWLGVAAGIWAFALVQSLYFLLPGRGRASTAAGLGDPFEHARERILFLLEEP